MSNTHYVIISGVPWPLNRLHLYPWPCSLIQSSIEDQLKYCQAIARIQALTGVDFDTIDAKIKSLTPNDIDTWEDTCGWVQRAAARGTLTAEWFTV